MHRTSSGCGIGTSVDVVRIGRNSRGTGLLALAVLLAGCLAPAAVSSVPPPPAGEWMLRTADGCRLYVREIGRGPVVVALHGGWGAESGPLAEALAPLAATHRVVLYDQRGSLRSPCPPGAEISVDRHVADLEAVREALGEERLAVVGHSMGGYLAMAWAARHPGRVARLVLVGSPPARWSLAEFGAVERSALERWQRPEVLATLRSHGLDREPAASWTDRQRSLWHRITWAAINLHRVERWPLLGGAFFHRGDAGAAAAATMPPEWDFSADLRSADVPILVLHGDDDFLPAEAHEGWIGEVPRARTVVLRGAGHVPWIERPEEFVGHLRAFLAEGDPRPDPPPSLPDPRLRLGPPLPRHPDHLLLGDPPRPAPLLHEDPELPLPEPGELEASPFRHRPVGGS